jgi:tetratricopeptide (TPR) repeat protein
MARFNDAYRPDPARAHQASGRHLAARSYLADGRPADAERELRTAVALDSRTLEYRLALTRLLSGDPARLDEARAIAEQTVADFPDEPDAYEALGAICVGLGELRDGLLAFLRALRCEPTEPWRVEVKVGQTFRDLGEHKRALPFLRAAYERAPEQSMTAVALAQSIRAWSEDEHPLRSPTFREAFGILTSSLRVNPDAADVLVCLAQSEAALHHPHRVRSLLRRALEDDPQHPFAGNFLGAVEDWLANRPPRRRPAPAGTSSVIRTSASIRPIR